jgi:hypothetical protein
MFRHLIRELETLSTATSISIPIEPDERGYIDKECPAKECLYPFKVLAEDWGNLFRDEAVFCPMCGHTARATEWYTTEQNEQAQQQALDYLSARIGSAIDKGVEEFNRRQPRTGFVRFSMKSTGTRRVPVLVPLQAAEVMEQALACEQCGARYAVVGAAFFCPCCGLNSVERMFQASLQKVRSRVERLDTVRDAVRVASGADEAEALCRSLLEDGLQHCVTAFQHYAERRYLRVPCVARPKMNAFQRLAEGDELLRNAVGRGYADWISGDDLRRLTLLFERRHLLAHREGIVDEQYLRKSGDQTYRPRQRIVVTAADVNTMATLIERLGEGIKAVTPDK